MAPVRLKNKYQGEGTDKALPTAGQTTPLTSPWGDNSVDLDRTCSDTGVGDSLLSPDGFSIYCPMLSVCGAPRSGDALATGPICTDTPSTPGQTTARDWALWSSADRGSLEVALLHRHPLLSEHRQPNSCSSLRAVIAFHTLLRRRTQGA